MFDVQNLAKAFASQELFSGVSFRIQKGDKIGLVGPNGAGKTTLIKILMGQEAPDEGSIIIGRETQVGYLAQEVPADAHGTVLERTLSGAGHVLKLERELDDLTHRLSHASPDEAIALSQSHAETLERYQALDGYTLLGRAKDILKGLGFSQAQMDSQLTSLSGGWHMRAELARLLLAHPDILFLDEPTNHLDLASLAWLEEFLVDYDGAFLVVSHDRYFLNRMATSIAELSRDGLYIFGGNYDDYVEARAELEDKFAKEEAARDRRAQELQAFVDRFRAKASKARQAQSRAKMLERVQAQEISGLAPKKKRTMRVQLPEPARSGDIVATLRDIKKRYGERIVYDGVSFDMQRGERVALVGDNGAGKSTMLKILAGVLGTEGGSRTLGHNVEPYYFAQHQTDALDPKNTVLQELRALVPLETETRVRGILGAFLFSGDSVDKYVSVLSGGEKSRLALAKMLAAPKNFLLLDEPTNHLDLQSRDVLEVALSNFTGSVCFISHDRYFIERLATRIVEVDNGVLTSYAGDYSYYQWKSQQERAEKAAAAPANAKSDKPKSGHAEEREARKVAQKEAQKREKETQKLEAEIHTSETRLKEIDALLCDPKVFADHNQTLALGNERTSLEAQVAALYARWEQLAG